MIRWIGVLAVKIVSTWHRRHWILSARETEWQSNRAYAYLCETQIHIHTHTRVYRWGAAATCRSARAYTRWPPHIAYPTADGFVSASNNPVLVWTVAFPCEHASRIKRGLCHHRLLHLLYNIGTHIGYDLSQHRFKVAHVDRGKCVVHIL